MNRNRNILILCLGLALAAGLSCSGETPLATQIDGNTPPGGGTVPPVDSGSVPPIDSGGVPHKTNLLMCLQQEYATNSAVIGPLGGQITVGDHTLKISAGALLQDVTITAEQVEDIVTSVRFSPEGLLFAVPAELTLSYKNCSDVKHPKRIVYTDDLLNILEPTLSQDDSSSRQVKGLIWHFSRYAVAF